MKNGFWNRYEKIKKKARGEEKEAVSFAFLKGFTFPVTMYAADYKEAAEFTAYDFLHGDCTVFAQYLSEKYGYNIVADFEWGEDMKEPWLIHMYCTHRDRDGNTVYVDVRGKCTDYHEFMDEFFRDGFYGNRERMFREEHTETPDRYRVDKDNWKYLNARVLDAAGGCYAPGE